MHQKDEQIKKNMDEFNNMKQKISAMTKKDTGSLTVKDFTDDIYKKHQNGDNFIGVDGSEMFTNLLLVINNEKFDTFTNNLPEMMERYYETMDNNEKKRVKEQAKN